MKIAILLALVAGCGGSPPPTDDRAGEHEEHHETLPPALAAFHDVLAPLWHSEASPDRTERTCAATASLREKAESVRTTPPPSSAELDPAGWQSATDALGSSVTALETACAAEGRADFESAFAGVHESFHALVERAGAAE